MEDVDEQTPDELFENLEQILFDEFGDYKSFKSRKPGCFSAGMN